MPASFLSSVEQLSLLWSEPHTLVHVTSSPAVDRQCTHSPAQLDPGERLGWPSVQITNTVVDTFDRCILHR